MLADQGRIALEDVHGPAAHGDGAHELWLGVLAQAMTDAVMPAHGNCRSYPTEAVTRARQWLANVGNPWTLALALSAADLDHDTWRSRCLPRLRERWRAADAGLGPPRRHGRQPARGARQGAIRPRGPPPQPDAGIGASGAP
jgi:hypothetical protein